MLSTLLSQRWEHNVGPLSNCTVGLCWPNMLGQRWANVVYRTTTVGSSLGQHCHFRWANVGSTTLAHCLTVLWAFICPTGCLYGRVIIGPTLRRTDSHWWRFTWYVLSAHSWNSFDLEPFVNSNQWKLSLLSKITITSYLPECIYCTHIKIFECTWRFFRM